ncbi:hypothetical protein GQ53DRAFT_815191 [Thozetella sp. PMI_491]|nr:hypothetical protein GQ53DRAFT_815191 [Thozetella sp. PMI_491]
MSSTRLVKTLGIARGVSMAIQINDAEPEDSANHYIVEVTATGAEGADIFYHHAEYMTVVEGRAQFTLGREKVVLHAGDPPLLIPRRVVHSMQSFKGERLVIREQSDPAGDYKAMFFNDLLSLGGFSNVPHILRAFYDGDAYLALPLYFRFFDEIFITVFGGIAKLFTAPKPKSL